MDSKYRLGKGASLLFWSLSVIGYFGFILTINTYT
jgi:hypothetical protein